MDRRVIDVMYTEQINRNILYNYNAWWNGNSSSSGNVCVIWKALHLSFYFCNPVCDEMTINKTKLPWFLDHANVRVQMTAEVWLLLLLLMCCVFGHIHIYIGVFILCFRAALVELGAQSVHKRTCQFNSKRAGSQADCWCYMLLSCTDNNKLVYWEQRVVIW